MSNRITRSTVNEQQYSAPQFSTSGFPLSYRRYSSFGLGRIHVAGFHWTMAGDKISGKTTGKGTFHRIVTEVMSPVNAMQYNIFIPLRPLDRTFKKGITPTKLNAMSSSWSMPLFNTRYLVKHLFLAYFGLNYNLTDEQINSNAFLKSVADFWRYSMEGDGNETLADYISSKSTTLLKFLYSVGEGIVGTPVNQLIGHDSRLTTMADHLYLRDALLDVANNITYKLGSTDKPISDKMLCRDFFNLYLSTLLTPWVGRYSYYGELKYKFLRPFDFYRISHGLGTGLGKYFTDFLNLFTDIPQNEYLIRGIYAVWYERFRNVDLEPVSATLPDWQEFSSTSIFDMSAGGNLCYLLYRPRPWETDMFISAQVDDMSRHVYAPIYNNHDAAVVGHSNALNNLDTNNFDDPLSFDVSGSQGSLPSSYNLSWRDQLTNEHKSIECPVPSNINDVLSALDKSFVDVYGLDLNALRQSQMLEKYLKRNYLFGDEYKDRMLAHYNSRVSDMRINKPEILSQSMDGYDMSQEVSNVSTDETKVGQRTATATLDVNGTEYSTYCEEFGIIFSIVCYMPRAMYDGDCPQNMMSKQIHLPLPEFAANNEEFGRKSEISGSGLSTGAFGDDQNTNFIFGRYPAYHAWRARVDEVGGEFLDEMQDCTFRRFFGMFSDDTTPKLNYFFLHCRPNLGMFANTNFYDMQLYADLVHECFVERVLPTPVEVI